MEIKWTSNLLEDLKRVVTFIKTSEMGEMFEEMYNYFTDKHSQYGQINEYYMNFLDSPKEPKKISDGEYRLAFLCQIINLRKKRFYNPYKCLCHIIKYALDRYWSVGNIHNNNNISYVVSILSEIWPQAKKKNLYNSVTIIQKVVKQDEDWTRFEYIYTDCEMIDLSILPPGSRRNILQVLETNKTFYLRLLLLIVQHVVKQDIDWFHLSDVIKFSKEKEMINVLKSPPIMITVIMTGYDLKMGHTNEEDMYWNNR